MPGRRSLTVLLVALVAAGSLAGCGDDPSPEEVVAGSPDATIEAGTAKVHQEITVEGGSGGGDSVTDGAVDLRRGRGSLVVEAAGQSVDLVIDGTTFYERIPGLQAVVGTPWVRMDLDALAERAGFEGIGSLSDASGNDPAGSLELLRGVGSVRERGSAKVRGTATTRYHAVVDYEQAASSATKPRAKALRRMADVLGTPTQPLDVWIDAAGRARRMSYEVDFRKAHLPDDVNPDFVPDSITVTVEYYDFGTKVHVELPDDEDVTDMADLPGFRPTVAPTPEHVALERSLLTDVPAGFEQQPDDVGDTGPSDLAKAVRDSGDENAAHAERLLRGFVAGYQRMWIDEADDQLIVFVYQFETSGAADSYCRVTADDPTDVEEDETATPVDLTGVPGASATIYTHEDDVFAMAQLDQGPYCATITMSGPKATPSVVAGLVRQQAARLGS